MKKLLFAILCMLCGLSMSAEEHYKPRISIGGRAGASMAQTTFVPGIKETWKYGPQGALTVRYTEEKLFALVGEVGFDTRGWREDFGTAPFSYERSLTYLKVPLLTHIYFGSKRLKGFVNLGPQVSYMLSESTTANFDYRNTSSVTDFPRNRHTEQMSMAVKNRFDYGICGGAGMEFYLSPRHSLYLEGRYYFGLGNIFPATKADVFSASRAQVIEISAGYWFRIQ